MYINLTDEKKLIFQKNSQRINAFIRSKLFLPGPVLQQPTDNRTRQSCILQDPE